ncbi:hypothetical protein QQ056_04040 [Oscillatoria laete-virens NRMC-F 0139]|nr:hypothetical protein [Oscillatoria laete-virens]MDL5052731.1 hypothetical protein [Oscillatoria laete-virens NRMC-F 0139]
MEMGEGRGHDKVKFNHAAKIDKVSIVRRPKKNIHGVFENFLFDHAGDSRNSPIASAEQIALASTQREGFGGRPF